jgi:hypothetical protein
VAPELEELAPRLMFSPTQSDLLAVTEKEGTGEPVMQEKPVRILAPGWAPKPLVKFIPAPVRWQ